MTFSPARAAFKSSPSPRMSGTAMDGIENGNKVGDRPCVRQSKIYRERESGNAMKSLFGQDHLSWKTGEQQGAFDGQGVYDAATHEVTKPPSHRAEATGGAPTAMGFGGQCQEIEYPLPGSVSACDACGNVVDRYYHCEDCKEEEGGLFDMCTECCAAVYLRQGSPRAMATVAQLPRHPTHQYATHRMRHVVPLGR